MKFKKITTIIGKAEDIFLMLLLSIIFILLLTQVVSRYVFNMPITWTEEAARYLQIWVTYIGMSLAIRYNAHVRITALHDRLPEKSQKFIQLIVNLIIITCLIAIIPSSFAYVNDQKLRASTAMQLPMNYVAVSLAIGYLMALFHIIGQTFVLVKNLYIFKKGK